ncbi:MAG: hypothetical protein KatS3mg076_0403 [Candidatus Binatia bacterium]|nr:MAG: hypothetical protein KatS3mg076_0403 [Candidatus Binatia bacterium]
MSALSVSVLATALVGLSLPVFWYERIRLVRSWQRANRALQRAELTALCLEAGGSQDALSVALPLVAEQAAAVAGILPCGSLEECDRFRVAAPLRTLPSGIRAAAALLAASEVCPAEIPDFAACVQSGSVRQGDDLAFVLLRARTSLPRASYERLLRRLDSLPYVACPLQRAGRLLGILLLVPLPGTDPSELALWGERLGSRLALLLSRSRLGRRSSRREPRPSSPAPRETELVLWVTARGEVVGHESLAEHVSVPVPISWAGVLSSPVWTEVREEAECSGLSEPRPVRLGDREFEYQVAALRDRNDETWGYCVLLRTAAHGKPARALSA